MAAKYFLDSSIFVASFDKQSPDKQAEARRLIGSALSGNGCTSWQAVQEFANVAIRGFESSFNHDALREYMVVALLPLCALMPDKSLYLEAVGVQQETRFSWLDSLILTSAIRLACSVLYSDILPNGQLVRGCRIVNPFS